MAWDENNNRYPRTFKTKAESYAAFKKLWAKSYKTFPTYALAVRYSGNDRASSWLRNVTKFYNSY